VQKWEKHWSNALQDKDMAFLLDEAHCSTIRLPIGYFTLGPEYCVRTPFEGEPAEVYRNAWSHVLSICAKLAGLGIGVLIDMHALPGGANKDSHSGTSNPTAELWGNSSNLNLAKRSLLFVAREIAAGKIPNCTGLQLCNEAAWAAKGMYDFYGDMLREIAAIDTSIPVYISDAWKLDTALEWAAKQNSLNSGTNLVIIDTHKYYTFDEKHKSKAPQEIINLLPEALAALNKYSGNVHDNGAAPIFIGEYSCVMDTRTWTRVSEDQKEGLTQRFGQCQCDQWHNRACGSAFWTLKMAWMPGGGWGFVAQTRKGSIRAPGYLALDFGEVDRRMGEAHKQRESLRQGNVSSHCNYWDNAAPGKRFEHWRFEAGWDDGWNDALAFFGLRKAMNLGKMGGDRIGCLDGWIRKRMREVGQTGPLGWEYEHGFRNAVKSAEQILLWP
jgi:aryl-phospho-beta-D-glucosidase BglC (GH1 family)